MESLYDNLETSLKAALQLELGKDWKSEYYWCYQLNVREPQNWLLFEQIKILRCLEPLSQSRKLVRLENMSPSLAMVKVQSYCLINYNTVIKLYKSTLKKLLKGHITVEELLNEGDKIWD